jgi:ABC-2 type transport system ATP-binding protein
LDEVEKVCSHVVVIREGIKLYSGKVEDMIASHGFFELQVESDKDELIETISNFKGISNVKIENDLIIATLNKPITSTEINKYLADNNITLSHLVKRKQSLEEQFLILTNNKN